MVQPGNHYFLPLVASLLYSGVAAQNDLCPTICAVSGPDTANWTIVGDFGQLQACHQPLVLNFSIEAPVMDKKPIQACQMWADDFNAGPVEAPAPASTEEMAPVIAWTPAESEDDIGGRLASQPADHLQSYLQNVMSLATKRTILFATTNNVTVGVYVGANLLNPSVAGTFFDPFVNVIYSGIANGTAALIQACDGGSRGKTFGVIAADTPDFTTVQDAVSEWSDGRCVNTSAYSKTWDLDPETISLASSEPIDSADAERDPASSSSACTRGNVWASSIVPGVVLSIIYVLYSL